MNRITKSINNPEKTRNKNTTTKIIKNSCSQSIKFIPLICILITITTKIFGGGPLDAVYQDALNLAQSNTKAATTTMQNFNPQEAFKNKDGTSYYTDDPSQAQHYQDITQGNAVLLEDAGRKKIDDNEATKAAYNSFNNPKIKIDPKEPWLSRSKDIIQNASAITTGISSNPGEPVTSGTKTGINCKEAKVCRVDLVKKTCNEKANSIKRICEKVPVITTKDETYRELQTHSGSISATGPRSGTFTVPASGSIINFVGTIGLPGIFHCPYTGSSIGLSLNGSRFSLVSNGCGDNPVWNFSKDNLDIPVTAYVPINLVIDECSTNSPRSSCNWWRGCGYWDRDRNMCAVWRNIDWRNPTYTVVMRANLTRKVAGLESWQEVNCSEI
jgi:hypothetical protein